MNCRQAQSDIALWAGNDLDESNLWCLQDHLQACPPCRAYLDEMKALMRLVEECPLRHEVDETAKLAVAESLWPTLSTRLLTLATPRRDHFNGWVPAVAVAVVCLAMVLIASPPQLLVPTDASTLSVNAEEVLDVGSSLKGPAPVRETLVDVQRSSPRPVPPLATQIEKLMNEGFPPSLLDGPLFFPPFESRRNVSRQERNQPRPSTVYIYRR